MQDQDEASQLVIEIAKAFVSTMQSMQTEWERAFLRFKMTDDSHCGCNASYEGPAGVSLISAIKYESLFDAVNELGVRLRNASANNGKRFLVFLLTIDKDFNYGIQFEHENADRWIISKMDGATGIPVGIQ